MVKPKRRGTGFSAGQPEADPKQQNTKIFTDQAVKEQQAVSMINNGKFQEAIVIYKDLISTGTRNHVVYANLAAIYLMQGSHTKSIPLLQKAIRLKPNDPDAHNNLGIALKEQGDLTGAIASYNNALLLKPNYPDAHNNLGNALKEQGDLNAAIASYNNALLLNPNDPDTHNSLGNTLKRQGDLNAAIASYNNALLLNPNNPKAHNSLGVALQERGDLNAAISSYSTALLLNPNDPKAHNSLGTALQEKGDLEAAITSYITALKLNPNDPKAHNNLGVALKEQGDLNAAIASYNKALLLKPDDPDAHNNLGNALKEKGDLDAAIASYNKALLLKPNYPEAHNNLGNALQEQGNLTAAIASYNTALLLKPDDPDAHNNLGNIFQQQGDINAAIASYNKALLLNPNHPEAQWNSSLIMLLSGDYKNGWEKYEWRLKSEKNPTKPHAIPKCDRLPGGHSLKTNSQLLLVTEQGLGDTLQFMRYATTLKDQGLSISLCAPPKLHTLIQSSGIDPSPLTPKQANEVSEGHWIPLLSVPGHLEVSPQNPVITEPYIKTTKELSAKWKDILSKEQRPIIGINWQGNPNIEKAALRGRSLALEAFSPIMGGSQLSLLSLQKGFGSEQLETCSFKDLFVSCQDQVNDTWDFLETAAIIANCDLVITSDTSVAHLAGGMGKTTWLLLHKVPDWRWGLEGDTTFWYPSMRLFRQSERCNWAEVMERVAEALEKHFGSVLQTTHSAPVPPITQEQIQDILAPISLGELIDKITILQIKTQHLQGTALKNAHKELNVLESTFSNLNLDIDTTLIRRLKEVNQDLWQIEDNIRDQERHKSFGETFIRLARSIYKQNDRRAAIKKEINTTYGSSLVEEKAYKDY